MADRNDENRVLTVEGPNGTWIAVARLGTEEEARLIEGFLEGEGIPVQIEVVKFNVEPVNFGDMSDVRLYVPQEHEVRAIELIQERREAGEHMRDDESVITEEGPTHVDDATGSTSRNPGQ